MDDAGREPPRPQPVGGHGHLTEAERLKSGCHAGQRPQEARNLGERHFDSGGCAMVTDPDLSEAERMKDPF